MRRYIAQLGVAAAMAATHTCSRHGTARHADVTIKSKALVKAGLKCKYNGIRRQLLRAEPDKYMYQSDT